MGLDFIFQTIQYIDFLIHLLLPVCTKSISAL